MDAVVNRMKWPSHRWWPIIAFGGILILLFATTQWTLPLLARWLDVSGPPQKADAIVLLTGSVNTRPFTAAALVHGGWAPKIIFNSGFPHASEVKGEVPPESEIILKILVYGGVPPNCIVCLDSKVQTTFDEARAARDYLADHPVKKLLIVTDGPHTRRARWILNRLLADRPVEIVMVSSPMEEFGNDNWWRSEEGFLFVVSEYLKFIYYGLRYGWLGYEILGGVAVIVFLGVWLSRRRGSCTPSAKR
ncbi:MAG: YdcF family protein [Thermoguttaceae bacterium]|jgi:uncharacterized SAM-binding protein YcdF (DUF218 family)